MAEFNCVADPTSHPALLIWSEVKSVAHHASGIYLGIGFNRHRKLEPFKQGALLMPIGLQAPYKFNRELESTVTAVFQLSSELRYSHIHCRYTSTTF